MRGSGACIFHPVGLQGEHDVARALWMIAALNQRRQFARVFVFLQIASSEHLLHTRPELQFRSQMVFNGFKFESCFLDRSSVEVNLFVVNSKYGASIQLYCR